MLLSTTAAVVVVRRVVGVAAGAAVVVVGNAVVVVGAAFGLPDELHADRAMTRLTPAATRAYLPTVSPLSPIRPTRDRFGLRPGEENEGQGREHRPRCPAQPSGQERRDSRDRDRQEPQLQRAGAVEGVEEGVGLADADAALDVVFDAEDDRQLHERGDGGGQAGD